MRKLFFVVSLLLLSGCVDFSQRLENAARLAWVDYDRVQTPPPSGRCSLSPIDWRGERVAVVLILHGQAPRLDLVSQQMRLHIVRQFHMRLVQRGAVVVDSHSVRYEMRIHAFLHHDFFSFEITVLDGAKRPVAYNMARHGLETPWQYLSERVQGELVETMALNSFVGLCAGSPRWQW